MAMQLFFSTILFTLVINNPIQNQAYTQDAVKILDDGTVLEGVNLIQKFYAENPVSIDSSWSTFKIAANPRFNYEVGGFKSGGNIYKHLIITTNEEDPKRVFEFISKADESNGKTKELDARREKWMELCNSHQVEELVRQLYAEKPIYYNHKPVISNPDALIAEYGYMKHPKYSLKLTPERFEFVRDDLAFEIGQCSGGYNGKYILIWKREQGGEWKVMVDSNI